MRQGTRILVALAVTPAMTLAVGPITAQAPQVPELLSFAVTSRPVDAPELFEVDAMIADRLASGELVVQSTRPDPNLPGRTHEVLQQVHRRVPIHGAMLVRQRDGGNAEVDRSAVGGPARGRPGQNAPELGRTVSVFGTLHDNVDVDVVPTLEGEAARRSLRASAGAGFANGEPPRLTIFPTPLGRLVLTWSAPMRDFRMHFVDAHSGETVYRRDLVDSQASVGFGMGITDALRKVSAWRTADGYQAWDRLRPGELVTLDVNGDFSDALEYLRPSPAWLDAVATDDDNEWTNPAIVEVHSGMGLVYDYLHQQQGWQGYDGANRRLLALTNVPEFQNAAFFHPPFGPQGGGGMLFGALDDATPLASLDVVAHEIMHGVTYWSVSNRTGTPFRDTHLYTLGESSYAYNPMDQVSCGDTYEFQDGEVAPLLCLDEDGLPTTDPSGRFAVFMDHGGAINESYSDILGIATEFAFQPPGPGFSIQDPGGTENPDTADYVLAEDTGSPVRRVDEPWVFSIGGVLSLPVEVDGAFRFLAARVGENLIRYTGYLFHQGDLYLTNIEDYAGVHWNSTILSHAYYLAIEGGLHIATEQEVTGVGNANRLQVERAFFRALTELAPPRVSLYSMGALIRQAAIDLHGEGSAAWVAIDQALTAVGIPAAA